VADVQSLRELLATEYGIHSDKELGEALSRMKKINIGVFTSRTKGKSIVSAHTHLNGYSAKMESRECMAFASGE